MKATCIVGSARTNGSTAFLIDTLIAGLSASDVECKKYNISEINMGFCVGCKHCYVDGTCIQNDDVEMVVRDILTSDVVVIAAPSYWAYVPGQLKTFFDRNTPYGDTNDKRILAADHKIKGIGIAVRAGMREQENTDILNAIEHYYGHLGIDMVKRISVTQTDALSDLQSKHQDVIAELLELGKNIQNL